MGDSMAHSLVNPNQLCHYGVKVQDDLVVQTALVLDDRGSYLLCSFDDE